MRKAAARPPLSAAEVQRFIREGFLAVEDVTSAREIASMRRVYDGIVERRLGVGPEAAERGPYLRQEPLVAIIPGEREARALRETRLFGNVVRLAARLLDVEQEQVLAGLRLFLKPAQHGQTRWHQDAAYRPPPHEAVSAWVPLDAATPETGCLSYLPGSHRRRVVRAHHAEGEHLVLERVDARSEVVCPLLPTAVLFHHCCTVHRASANTTSRPRRALGIVCQARDV